MWKYHLGWSQIPWIVVEGVHFVQHHLNNETMGCGVVQDQHARTYSIANSSRSTALEISLKCFSQLLISVSKPLLSRNVSSSLLATPAPPIISSSSLRALQSVSSVGRPLLSHLLRRSLRKAAGPTFWGVLWIVGTSDVIPSWSASASQWPATGWINRFSTPKSSGVSRVAAIMTDVYNYASAYWLFTVM